MLSAIAIVGPSCSGSPPPPPPATDGYIPVGSVNFTVQAVDDACALQIPQFMVGRTIGFYIQQPGTEVIVSAPDTTLPTLTAMSMQDDVFTTAAYTVPITALDGACQGMRSQVYSGKANSASQYQLLFESTDSMPTGQCGGTPIPCETVVTMVLPYCQPGASCAATAAERE